jgi:hypothetical protein
VELLAVCFLWVGLFSSTRQKLAQATGMLARKARVILWRRASMMRDASAALVQHFNPACRIARAYPAYPLLRILFSLNDYDEGPGPGLGPRRLGAIVFGILLRMVYLPRGAQVMLAQCLAVCALNSVGVVLYHMAVVARSVAVPVALLVAANWTIYGYLQHCPAVAAEDRKSEQLFKDGSRKKRSKVRLG